MTQCSCTCYDTWAYDFADDLILSLIVCTCVLNRKLLGEYIDKEAELSGSEGGASDEDLDFGEEGDLLELEQGDMEDVGTDEQLRSQVAKAHA